MQQLARLADGNAGVGGGHVHEVALVQRRHEFAADLRGGPEADNQHDQRQHQGGFRRVQHAVDQRFIGPGDEAIYRVFVLRQYLAAHKPAHEHRHQRYRQRRRHGHGVGLGEGQWREHLAFLRFQREHRQEAHGDDEQREEQRRADFRCSFADDLPAVFVGERGFLDVLVHVFHHDNGPVHHGADGDGDAAQGHDVGVQPLRVHDDERAQYADGQAENDHQR